MSHRNAFVFAAAVLALSACNWLPSNQNGGSSSSSMAGVGASSIPDVTTQNVTYTGLLEKAGISIYQQGTHRLQLPGNRFLLLESTAVQLESGVGQQVEVTGSVKPTVEAGGIIMTVDSMTILAPETDSGMMMSVEASSSSSTSSASSIATSSAATSSTVSVATVSVAKSSVLSVAASSAAASSAVRWTSELEERINAIAQEDLAPSRWTQQYCSSHIGFCIPVHKNWWFKSFGATSSSLWHVEINNAPIDAIGTGPILVNVRSGTVESAKAVDGQVRVQGDRVIGFRSWTDNRHFTIEAPRELEGAVQYITKNLAGYQG